MNYSLIKTDVEREKEKGVLTTAWKRLVPLMAEEGKSVTIAFMAILVNATSTLVVPIIIAHIVDTYIVGKDFHGVLVFSGLLFVVFLFGLVASYVQVKTMGGLGRRLFLICEIKYLASSKSFLWRSSTKTKLATLFPASTTTPTSSTNFLLRL